MPESCCAKILLKLIIPLLIPKLRGLVFVHCFDSDRRSDSKDEDDDLEDPTSSMQLSTDFITKFCFCCEAQSCIDGVIALLLRMQRRFGEARLRAFVSSISESDEEDTESPALSSCFRFTLLLAFNLHGVSLKPCDELPSLISSTGLLLFERRL